MKKFSWLAVILIMAMMSWAFIGCGSSSDDDESVLSVLFNLSALQGPNKKVVEPEEIPNSTPSGNFFLEESPDAKAQAVVELALAITNPPSQNPLLDFDPHNIIYDTMDLGYMMAGIAAEGATDACDTLKTDLDADVGGDCAYSGLPENCSITSEEKGRAKITFDTDDSGGCDFSFTGDENEGAIEVRGKLVDPLYPALDGPGYDCAVETCKDVKVAALSSNFGIVGGDAITGSSVISGYALNYSLDSDPDIYSLPLYIVANLKIEDENMALGLALPNGLTGSASQYYGGVFDSEGKIYGINYKDIDTDGDDDLLIATLPIQDSGTFCYSWFINDGAGTYTYDQSESGHECGLTDGISVTP